MPPGAGPGLVNDAFFRYVGDMGAPGPDRGAGGKYLYLPPGYDGKVPEGYFVAKSPSFTNWVALRGFLKDGKPDHAAQMWQNELKIYPLASAGSPPKMEAILCTGKIMNTIHSNDFAFYEEVNAVIQYEPIDFMDPELRGNLTAIGIMKGRPFEPDARLKALLTEAAAIGNATSRALSFAPRSKTARIYDEDSEWVTAFDGGDYRWLVEDGKGGRNADARTRFFYFATGNTPAMVMKMVDRGSQYALVCKDAKHKYLDGAKCYSLTLPPNVPAKDFWSVVVYDTQTRSMLKTSQLFPCRNSLSHADMKQNPDGSTTVWFAPSMWWGCLRLYGPGQAWFDQTWRPGEVTPSLSLQCRVEEESLVRVDLSLKSKPLNDQIVEEVFKTMRLGVRELAKRPDMTMLFSLRLQDRANLSVPADANIMPQLAYC
ncbi:unnamed protein product [Symbiodinium natans]|uniref:DUF1214 domain-containing protein n=1 Tax=Symbiodinium natans TaxID=878477 RepID=A0A812ST27_9DINO|nr:unnamed protein product [Symbiodinium natans]